MSLRFITTDTALISDYILWNLYFAVVNQKLVFQRDQIFLDPPEPTVPGTFRIISNVSVTQTIRYVAAELELRLGDWVSDPLPCQEKRPDGCGGKGSW